MAGRESRPQLLATSFLMLATALACGGTVITKSDGEAGSSSTRPDDVSGGTNGKGDPGPGPSPAPTTAGSGSNPPEIGGQPCPATVPAAGTYCVGTQTCVFGDQCGQSSPTARCVANQWQVSTGRPVTCNPPVHVCPAMVPRDFTPCDDDGLLCRLDDATCVGGLAFLDCRGGFWQIENCPRMPPITSYGGAGPEGGAPFIGPDFAGAPSFAGDSGIGPHGLAGEGGAGGAR
ncbi:MAG TPA: hypothetical protein VEQ59_17795 [Polyangiaceae bacterium]|nr:hypothetical protein [Polyangiaceae bacterium]